MITSVFRYRDGAETPIDPVIIDRSAPVEERLRRLQPLIEEACERSRTDPSAFMWIKLADPTDRELAFFAESYGWPDLEVEDAARPRQRAKVEEVEGGRFVVLKELRYETDRKAVETGQVAVFVGRGYAVSIRHGDAAPGSARERLKAHIELTRYGPMSVLWAVMDVIVDGYLAIVNELGNEIEAVEEIVFSERRTDHAGLIYNLKRENLEVKRAVAPLEFAAAEQSAERDETIPAPLSHQFHDVGDHVLRANEMVETYDQLLMAMLMASTSQQDLRQNRDMRKISAWAAIIAVPTAIAGIYGMNFEEMPELHWHFGYPMVLGIMAAVCLLLYWRFKRSGWL